MITLPLIETREHLERPHSAAGVRIHQVGAELPLHLRVGKIESGGEQTGQRLLIPLQTAIGQQVGHFGPARPPRVLP